MLQHIHNFFSPTLHTPILLVGQPYWTSKNLEDITQFIFEKFKTPGLCIIDSAIASSYAFGVANATVVDVGFEKTDITTITDFVISARGRVFESGGEALTRRLMEVLKNKNFTRDMAEQLKKSPICEILPLGTPLPGTMEATVADDMENTLTTTVTSLGTATSTVDTRVLETAQVKLDEAIEEDGVLDIATIVTSGKTQDFLARKEKEKSERAAVRKAAKDLEKADSSTIPNKVPKLPNSRRPYAIFHYEEYIKDLPNSERQKTPEIQEATKIKAEEPNSEEKITKESTDIPAPDNNVALPEDEIARKEHHKVERKEEKKRLREDENPQRIRRDIEVGTERFQAADDNFMDAIADAIYRVILSIDDISKRHDAWESLIICGSGSKVRGFKEALLSTLCNRYLLSPNSASTFISEPPSNLGTPSGTGTMTPNGSFPSAIQTPTGSTVNPLLLAATTASNLAHAQSTPLNQHLAHPSRLQSPTSIKTVNPPTYFPEWKQYEEAAFLGSQVASKVFFVNDQGQSKAFLTRMEFNEDGPTAIHQV